MKGIFVNAKTAVEMTFLWKAKSASLRNLQISHSTRDSHIPTADPLLLTRTKRRTDMKNDGSDPSSDQPAAGKSHPRPIRNRQEQLSPTGKSS
jgi:hypothetical protein